MLNMIVEHRDFMKEFVFSKGRARKKPNENINMGKV